MKTIKERAEQSAQSIIDWCYSREVQARERDDDFPTSEVMRAMMWQKQIDINNACAEIDAILQEYGIKSADRHRNINRVRKAMEE